MTLNKTKLGFTSVLLGLTLVLSACGNEKPTSKTADEPKKEEVTPAPSTSTEETAKETPATTTEGPLTEVGQQMDDPETGLVTLDKIVRVYKHFEIGGFIIKIKDAKVLTVTNIVPSFKESVEGTGENQITGSEFTFLQVDYDLENTTDQTVIFNGMETAVTNNGKQISITAKDIFMMANPTSSEILAKASIENNVFGIPVDKNISSIRIKPSDVLYDNADHSVFYPKEISIKF